MLTGHPSDLASRYIPDDVLPALALRSFVPPPWMWSKAKNSGVDSPQHTHLLPRAWIIDNLSLARWRRDASRRFCGGLSRSDSARHDRQALWTPLRGRTLITELLSVRVVSHREHFDPRVLTVPFTPFIAGYYTI